MKSRRLIALVLFVVVSLSAGMIGSQFPPGDWYRGLEKPSWNPPDFLFAPVWTLLYILMGVAVWLVWTRGEKGQRHLPLSVFAVQLVVNALWSWLFFGIRRPDLAFIDILVMWVLICATIVLFWKVKRSAGLLLIPYLAWVSFATALNFQLWRLNL
jgi:tryptophan-rich sensory protein